MEDGLINAKFNITIDNYRVVTSNPLRICMCTNSIPNCITEKELTIFPGQMFQFKAAAVGQRYGIVSNIVTAELLGSNGNLEQGQDVQSVGGECTMLYYTVYSNQDFERIRLRVGDLLTKPLDDLVNRLPAQHHALFQDLVIKIKLKDCLLGFVFDTNKRACLCSPKSVHTVECFVTLTTITLQKPSNCGSQHQQRKTTDYLFMISALMITAYS